ncbi:MAG: CotH kinase family protein [Bacteroidota bacterium]
MRRNLFYFLFPLFILSVACSKETNTEPQPVTPPPTETISPFAVDVGDSDIPYIIIDTKGTAIENEPKVPAEMTIYIEKQEVQKANIGIEFRGSTSFRLSDKKSYGIETWDAAGEDINLSFFDFPEEEDWVLIGHVVNLGQGFTFDRTLMYHHFGYELSRSIGRYASRSKHVELEINGEYLGIYMFMEKLKRNKNRIPLKKLEPTDTDAESITGGYILKIDKTSGGDIDNLNQPLSYFENNWADDARYTQNNSFRSNYDINGQPIDFSPYNSPYHSQQYLETYFLYEYPKPDIITNDQKAYIQNYINEFETALLADDFGTNTRTYTDYIDVPSFVDYFLLSELVRNIDGYRLSTYLTKDRGEKLKMGPVWDLNIGYDNPERIPFDDWVINYNNYVNQDAWMMPFWWLRLLSDPQFKAAVRTRWTALRTSELQTSNLLSLVDDTANNLIDNGAIERNATIWGNEDYTSSVNNLKNYLENRAAWMDSEIGSF